MDLLLTRHGWSLASNKRGWQSWEVLTTSRADGRWEEGVLLQPSEGWLGRTECRCKMSHGETQPRLKMLPRREGVGKESLTSHPASLPVISARASRQLNPTPHSGCGVLWGQPPQRGGLRRAGTESGAGDQVENKKQEEQRDGGAGGQGEADREDGERWSV